MFEKLMNNPALKKFFLKQFKDIVSENGVKTIVLRIKEGGDFDADMYKEDITVIKTDDYNKMIDTIKSQL